MRSAALRTAAGAALAAGLVGGITAPASATAFPPVHPSTIDVPDQSGGWMPPPDDNGGWMPAPEPSGWDCDPRYPADNYVIQSGDTAAEIAAEHGISLAALIAYNPRSIEDADRLCVGETLYVG